MTAHGFRAMARTLIVERLPGIAPDVIEAQLAHGKSGPLGTAYDRAEFMEQRRQMMVTWANYLDQLRRGAQVNAVRGCVHSMRESGGDDAHGSQHGSCVLALLYDAYSHKKDLALGRVESGSQGRNWNAPPRR